VTDNSILVVGIAAMAILVAIVLTGILRGTGSGNKSDELKKLRRNGAFWGVRIQPGKCTAIRPFAGRRFTFEEAPNLPLSGCKAWRRGAGTTPRGTARSKGPQGYCPD
jgi:hypothetical protein